MPAHCLRMSVLVGMACGGLWCLSEPARAQSLSPAAGPQQMIPSGIPESYPSTGPSPYPSAYASPYASTGEPALGSPALAPYSSSQGPLGAPGPRPNSSNAGPVYTPYGSPDAMTAALDSTYPERTLTSNEPWTWQVAPTGLLYQPDLASGTECRLATKWDYVRGQGWFWDPVAGGRAGLLRYGTEDDAWPQGWQLDIAGAAFPRLDSARNMVATDFRIAVPLTMRQGPWEFKFGYTHLSSHIGDLYLINNPGFVRINYVRDSLAMGLAVYLNPDVRLYAESGWAFHDDGGAQQWEFQFGLDLSPSQPTTTIWGAPFFALNGHLRQENDFGGNFTAQTGVQWRGRTGNLLRLGAQYFNGMSEFGQFYNRFEEQIGVGLWYDF